MVVAGSRVAEGSLVVGDSRAAVGSRVVAGRRVAGGSLAAWGNLVGHSLVVGGKQAAEDSPCHRKPCRRDQLRRIAEVGTAGEHHSHLLTASSVVGSPLAVPWAIGSP